MRKRYLGILLLWMLGCLASVWGQEWPLTSWRFHNDNILLCETGVHLCDSGFYDAASDFFAQCTAYCDACKTMYATKIADCERRKKIVTEKRLPSEKKNESRTVRVATMSAVGQDSICVNSETLIARTDSTSVEPCEAEEVQRNDRPWISGNMIRADTLIITDNSHLVHPYFIKSWRMEKKAWRWTFNSIGLAAVGGSIGLGVGAARNYRLHEGNTAPTRREHERYYRDYRLYSGLMGGCIALAVVSLSANILAVQVRNDVKIVPGVWMDRQGNVQASVTVKF